MRFITYVYRSGFQDTDRGLVRLDPSPTKQALPLPRPSPVVSSASLSPRHTNGRPPPPTAPQRGNFKPVNIPTQPRNHVPQSRPAPASNLFGDRPPPMAPQPPTVQVEPVAVLEEEMDSEKVLEERRRKRVEIMAKFRANGGKPLPAATIPAAGDAAPESGLDSVGSGGARTGFRTGVTSATGKLPRPIGHLH